MFLCGLNPFHFFVLSLCLLFFGALLIRREVRETLKKHTKLCKVLFFQLAI
jgi:hypothetical protein